MLLIDHIDKITRNKQRDTLFLFCDSEILGEEKKKEILAWLDQENISYEPCGPYASENSIFAGGGGDHLYLDLPYDPDEATFLKLDQYFEKDGKPTIQGVKFCFLPLDYAMKNQHHDEDGYWDSVVENF